MNNKGFTIIELLAAIIIIVILASIIGAAVRIANRTCLEYGNMPVTECYNMGGHTTCYQTIRKSCVRYEK